MPQMFTEVFQQFHFLRPLWLYSFIPLILLLIWSWRKKAQSKSWVKVIDKNLQPFVLTQAEEMRGNRYIWLPLLALIICVIALAGPVWEKLPQTVYKPQSALVIVLDLSRSMDAADIKPSRLTRAKLKIIDLLQARSEGQSALIVYAAQPFTVSPLTDDNDTIISLLNSLSTDIMPTQGSRMDEGLAKAQDLLSQAGIQNGHILIVSDGVTLKEFNGIKALNIKKHTISVLAVGTEEGAPINEPNGGYLKDANGQIVVAKMNRRDLLSLAQATQGVFATLRNDDQDIQAIQTLIDINRFDHQSTQSDQEFDVWYEHGSWLLLLVVPIALMAFRKGFLVVLVALVLPVPQSAEALDWQQWFKNDDQKALEQFNAGDYETAGQQFKHNDWKAASQFKGEQFEDALQHYESSNDLYNKGNALAKMERYKEALEAWEDELKLNPNNDDAAYNKKQLEEFLKQQQNQDQQNQQDQDQQNQQNPKDQEQQQQEQQQKDQQQDQQQNSDQQSEQGQESEEQSQQEQSEQQNDKDEQEEGESKEQSEAEKQQEQQAKEQNEEEKTAEQLAAEQKLKEEMNDPLNEETKQWLRRVPDDPGGLLRNKFRYQYKQLNRQSDEQIKW